MVLLVFVVACYRKFEHKKKEKKGTFYIPNVLKGKNNPTMMIQLIEPQSEHADTLEAQLNAAKAESNRVWAEFEDKKKSVYKLERERVDRERAAIQIPLGSPALYAEFMRAERLDIVSQNSESPASKTLSDKVSKAIKEKRENKHYFTEENIAKCFIDSDTANDSPVAWQYVGDSLLQKCKKTDGKLIVLITPDGDYAKAEPRMTQQQKEQMHYAQRTYGIDVREIRIHSSDNEEKLSILVMTNVMMEKQKADEFMKAERVNVLSTQYKDKDAKRIAQDAQEILSKSNTFCYNPNTDSEAAAGGSKKVADGIWLELFSMMVKHASAKSAWTDKKKPGKVFQLVMDGQLTSMQGQERDLAKLLGVDVVRIDCTSSTTKVQLRSNPHMMKYKK